MTRNLGQLAINMAALYKWHRKRGNQRLKAICKTALFDAQTKAAAACMAVLRLAVACAIAWAFGPYGGVF